MPRQKLSEYRAKTIVSEALGLPYKGWPVDAEAPLKAQLNELPAGPFVLKVDEGVKGRFKKGLVLLNIKAKNVPKAVKTLHGKGYRWLIVEPMVVHDQAQERYISLTSDKAGWVLNFTASGGVD